MPLWANRVLKVTNQSVNSAKPNICGVSYVLVLGLGTGEIPIARLSDYILNTWHCCFECWLGGHELIKVIK